MAYDEGGSFKEKIYDIGAKFENFSLPGKISIEIQYSRGIARVPLKMRICA